MFRSPGRTCGPYAPIPVNAGNINNGALKEKRDLLAQLKTLRSRASSYQKNTERALRKRDALVQDASSAAHNSIAEDISAVPSFFVKPEKTEDTGISESKKNIEKQLYAIMADPGCPAAIKAEVPQVLTELSRISDYHNLETFNPIFVKPLLRRYEAAIAKQREETGLFRELQSRHAALCSITQIQPRDFAADLERRAVLQVEDYNLRAPVSAISEGSVRRKTASRQVLRWERD
jgi:hypothetical protein